MSGRLRITGGILVRRLIDVPAAADRGVLRPTSDKVRQAVFGSLQSRFDLEDRHVVDVCCGSGALYNLTQESSSSALRARKLHNAAATGAEVIVTANPGCLMQLSRGEMTVVHIADLLDEAYRAE